MLTAMRHQPLPALLAFAASALLATGCATTPTSQRDLAPTVRVAAYMGTAYALSEHPEWRPSFETARSELAFIEAADTIDFATVLAIVHRLPIEAIRDSKAAILVTGAIILLTDYGASLPPDQMDKLRPIVRAMREGIELGLGPAPATLGRPTL